MAEQIKRMLHERVLHLQHVTEQMMSAESGVFNDLARSYDISSIPDNLTSVHVIDCIGNHEPINNTAIAEKMNLSKASISKISAKLLKENFVRRSQLNDNKKEVYFTLSPKGRQIYEIHARMHHIFEQRFITMMNGFSEAELLASLKFIQAMIDQKDQWVSIDEDMLHMLLSQSQRHE